MNFNLKQALTYFLKDDKLIKKSFILFLFVFMSNFLISESVLKNTNTSGIFICALITIFSEIILQGFFPYFVHNKIINFESKIPEWSEIFKFIKIGFKRFIGSLTLLIIFLLPILLLCLVFFASIPKDSSLIQKNLLLYLSLIILFFIFLLIYFILTFLVLYAADMAFISDLKLKSYFNFKKIKIILIDNFSFSVKYILILIFALIIMFCIAILIFLFPAMIFGGLMVFNVISEYLGNYILDFIYSFIISIFTVWFLYFMCDIASQFLRSVLKIDNFIKNEQDNNEGDI